MGKPMEISVCCTLIKTEYHVNETNVQAIGLQLVFHGKKILTRFRRL
ncbi:hypothetical protein MJ1HA_1677 [Metallosphaera sedula]|nr:hypothetical protein MJ1HA_1677 [Metallosphaera sedula]